MKNRRRGDFIRYKDVSPILRVIGLLAIIVYCLGSYWLFWPYQPYKDMSIRILNEDKRVRAGEFLIYEQTFDKRMPLPVMIYKQLLNDFIITYAPIIGNVPTGQRTVKVKLKIPKHAEPGIYQFKWEGRTAVNPMRTIETIVISEKFAVVGDVIDDRL